MPKLKVQELGDALYICIPASLMKEDPPIAIRKGDTLIAERTHGGFLYTPEEHTGSVWMLIPED